MFAKLFGPDEDQVLVTINEGDNGPEVKFSCKPQGLGVCSVAAQFPDNDEGWEQAEKAFASVDEDLALSAAKEVHRQAAQLANQGEGDG